MGRARGMSGVAAFLRTVVDEREDRFAEVFGVRRGSDGSSHNDEADCQRTYANPGPLLELHRHNGRRIWVRIIRPGDLRGDPGEEREERQAKQLYARISDNYLVSFMEEVTRPDLQAKYPNGFPFGGCYYVGTLRQDGDRHLAQSGLAFSTDEKYAASNLPADQCRMLLAWLDEQCP